MDGGRNYGKCRVCNGTMSVHINVSKPLDHSFEHEDTMREAWMRLRRLGHNDADCHMLAPAMAAQIEVQRY